MTLEACYQQLGGSYAEIRARIPSDAMISRFIGAFLKDPSFGALVTAANAGDRAAAFSAVHTLKGVCANLGLEDLRHSAGALTEVLRPEADTIPQAALPLLAAVQRDYRRTVDAISAYLAEQ